MDTDEPWALSITTDRLTIRPFTPADHEVWLAGFTQRLPKQSKYDPGQLDMTECNAEWFENLCGRHQKLAQEDKVYIWGLFTHDGAHLGHVDIATIRRADNQWANLGYSIHNYLWRQGYAKEAVSAGLRAGFETLGFHRIEAAINLDNDASIALAKSVGMQYEGIRRGFFWEDEQWVDHHIYTAIPSDLGLKEPPPLEAFT